MSRPKKWRKVCGLPEVNRFGPLNGYVGEAIMMSIDEYETIRLIDFEGFTQEESAKNMNIARTTVQAIYQDARKKIADALVNGKSIIIKGGEYRLCDGRGRQCGKMGCGKRQ